MRMVKRLSIALMVVHWLSACSVLPSGSTARLFSDDSDKAHSANIDKPINDSRGANQQLSIALAAIAEGNIDQADKAFTDMLAAGARSPVALNHYAIFLREQWRIDEAERVYQQALQHSPNNAMTHWNLAVLYELYRGNDAQALAHFEAYQRSAVEPDKRVAGWIADLTRRIDRSANQQGS